jgi:xanthine dehydrogenase accessory factor
VKHADLALARLAEQAAVWVTVESTQGSVPRDAGTWMAVFADNVVGTIGGGHVEHQAMAQARRRLNGEASAPLLRYALGPSLGQCCGGVMHLRFETVDRTSIAMLQARLDSSRTPLALFGGGHVGHALVDVLARLPFAVTWIDSRDSVLPTQTARNVVCEHSEPVQSAVAQLAPGSAVLVMSFSHAEDLDIVAACLQRLRRADDLPYLGLIGSRTKWATFRHRLAERGFLDDELARVTCPIGLPDVPGKEPEVIAIAVAAQLLQWRSRLSSQAQATDRSLI